MYGRRHMQPFEFSAFWHSAESNRAGTRPARSPEDEPVDDSRDGDAETSMAWGRSDAHGRARQSTRGAGGGGDGGGFGSADRRKYSSTGSRGDAASTWRKKKPTSNTPPGRNERWTRRGEASEAGTWLAEAPSSAPERLAPPSPSSSPSSSPSLASDDARVRTWPDRKDVSVVAERASFVDFLRDNLAVSTCVRTSPADRIGDLASQTCAWGGTGSLDELLARRDAPERSRRRNEGTGELTRALTSPGTSLAFAAG